MSLYQLYKLASKWDVFLIFLTVLCSSLTGLCKVLNMTVTAQTTVAYLELDSKLDSAKHSPNTTLTFIDEAREEFSRKVQTFAFQFLLIAGLWFFLQFLSVTMCEIVSERIRFGIRTKYFEALLHREITWFDLNDAGTVSTALLESTNRIKDGINALEKLCFTSTVVLSALFVATITNWQLTLIFLIFFPMISYTSYTFNKKTAANVTFFIKQYAKAGSIVEEALCQIRTVLAFNGQNYEIKRYGSALEEATKNAIWNAFESGLGLVTLYTTMNFVYFTIFWIATDFVYFGYVDAKEAITIFSVINSLSFALGDLFQGFGKIAHSVAGSKQILDEIAQAEIDFKKPRKNQKPVVNGRITFESVQFSYPRRPDVEVLKKLSFTCEPGEKVALVGGSGAGKSTIFGLLMRFYNPEKGQIKIDDTDIEDFEEEYLRSEIGIVRQEPVLFDATIRQNLHNAKQDATEAEMLEALDQANALKFVRELPQGLDTRVGTRGSQLSGGQKQRIAIARMLLRNPRILLLDEATSALDNENERAVQEALEKAYFGRTTLIIAHRLSTIRSAEKIIVLKDGQAIEAGTHQSLLAEKGHYYDLVNAQLFNRPKKEPSPEPGTFPTKEQLYSTQVSVEKVKMRRASMKETEKPTISFWDLYNLLDRKTKGIFVLAIFFGLTEGIVPPIYGLLFAQQEMGLVDSNPERMRAKGHAAAWNWIYLCCFEGFRILPMTLCFSIASCRLTEKIRVKIFENVLNQNGKFHDAAENSSGKLTALIAWDAAGVRKAFGEPLGELCKGSVAAILGLFIGFYLNWQTTLLMLIIVPMASFHGITLRKLLLTYHREESSMNVNSSDLLSEALANIKTVQCLNLQKPLLETYCEKLEKRVQIGQKRAKIRAFMNAVNAMMNAWINSLKQGFASWLSAWDSTFDPISVMRTQFSLTNVVVDVKSATGYIDTHSRAQVSVENIGRLLELKPEIDNELDQNLDWGKIEFKNVSFTYPEQPEEVVLKNVSFTIQSGQRIGVVGRSGSGKSTIVALLQRIYSTKNGSVLIDETEISKVPLHYLRSQIAVVSQEPTLFDDSIFNNIGYGLNLEVLSMKSVIEVAKVAGIHEFIITLPDGYETKVGALGSQLSGGQKQRIAIVRALVRKPKILIFDEATSALDSETEKSVQASIDLAAHGTTCITIAHRLASIKNCDRILVFEKGKLVEEGDHETLLNTQGIYSRLATLNDHNL